MNRRNFIKHVSATAFGNFTVKAVAASVGAPAPDKLPFRQVVVKSDATKAVFFFDFSCQFSANYHIPMLNWERTLPKGPGLPEVTVDYVPVINYNDQRRRSDMAIAAAGYYAGVSMCRDRAQLKSFIEAVYDARLRDGHSLSSRSLWEYTCRTAAFNISTFLTKAAKVDKDLLAAAARRLSDYKVSTTPTVGVAGQFVLTPDEVNGDREMFFNILNGLASNYLLV